MRGMPHACRDACPCSLATLTRRPSPCLLCPPLPPVIGHAESCQQLLRIEGMTCSACSSAVEAALRAVHGVQEANVNLLSGVAEVGAAPLGIRWSLRRRASGHPRACRAHALPAGPRPCAGPCSTSRLLARPAAMP